MRKFGNNTSRKNVLPVEVAVVKSDTSGLIIERGSRIRRVSKLTEAHPDLLHLLCRWLADNNPDGARQRPSAIWACRSSNSPVPR